MLRCLVAIVEMCSACCYSIQNVQLHEASAKVMPLGPSALNQLQAQRARLRDLRDRNAQLKQKVPWTPSIYVHRDPTDHPRRLGDYSEGRTSVLLLYGTPDPFAHHLSYTQSMAVLSAVVPGARANTDFSTFLSPSFSKVRIVCNMYWQQ